MRCSTPQRQKDLPRLSKDIQGEDRVGEAKQHASAATESEGEAFADSMGLLGLGVVGGHRHEHEGGGQEPERGLSEEGGVQAHILAQKPADHRTDKIANAIHTP